MYKEGTKVKGKFWRVPGLIEDGSCGHALCSLDCLVERLLGVTFSWVACGTSDENTDLTTRCLEHDGATCHVGRSSFRGLGEKEWHGWGEEAT
jgi:hypothetical protein